MAENNVSERILDNYAEFEYKAMFLRGTAAPEPMPLWVPSDDARRLRSYQILESFCRNKGREWTPETADMTVADIMKRREYGDPELIVETALSSLIGEQWRIHTEGQVEDDAAANAQTEALEEWSEKVNFDMKMFESERQSVKFGDSVYVLGVNDENFITMDVYDPGFYFPVLDESSGTSEYPEKVHIAWEWEEELDNGKKEQMVTRLTWELVETERPYSLPWNDTATKVCVYRELTVALSDIPKRTGTGTLFSNLEDLAPDREVNMGLDFLPLVHVPNTINLQHHFGRSILANVMQLLDDVQATDTDLQASSATTGSPPIVVTGRGANVDEQAATGPGMVIQVGDGTATIMDTSRSLDALLKMKDSLLSRLSINSRTPEALLGRVKPNEVPSGIALTLGFTPHINLIRQMRTVRKRKYSLLFKFVKRMMLITEGYDLEMTEELRTDLALGSFLPADLPATTDVVIKLLESNAVSLETAVRMLLEAGVPIEDIGDEIAQIQSRDVDTAVAMVNISGDPNPALEYLGLPPIPDWEEQQAALNVEPPPGDNPEDAPETDEDL